MGGLGGQGRALGCRGTTQRLSVGALLKIQSKLEASVSLCSAVVKPWPRSSLRVLPALEGLAGGAQAAFCCRACGETQHTELPEHLSPQQRSGGASAALRSAYGQTLCMHRSPYQAGVREGDGFVQGSLQSENDDEMDKPYNDELENDSSEDESNEEERVKMRATKRRVTQRSIRPLKIRGRKKEGKIGLLNLLCD